jgi:DnaJ-class molecular chaperone
MSTEKMHEKSSHTSTKRYECVYCKGKGVDHFGVMSTSSLCSVCLGKGDFEFTESAQKCVYCQGTGDSPTGTRCACLACRGRGVIAVAHENEICQDCHGFGTCNQAGWYCFKCHGAGLVARPVIEHMQHAR